jgi:hypothetical protein
LQGVPIPNILINPINETNGTQPKTLTQPISNSTANQ